MDSPKTYARSIFFHSLPVFHCFQQPRVPAAGAEVDFIWYFFGIIFNLFHDDPYTCITFSLRSMFAPLFLHLYLLLAVKRNAERWLNKHHTY